MAGGRRNINRSGAKQHTVMTSEDSKPKYGDLIILLWFIGSYLQSIFMVRCAFCSFICRCSDTSGKSVTPKHMPMPVLPHDNNITFELIMFSYTAVAVFLQFLHLYRSVWWLPNSHTSQTMV